MNPFEIRPLADQTLFQRILGRPNPANGYVTLGNLLAEKEWDDLHEGHVEQALRQHGVKELDRSVAKRLYEKALARMVADDVIDDREADALLRLRRLLGLLDSEIAEVEQKVIHPRFQRSIDEVLVDDTISDQERTKLENLRRALRLAERQAIALIEGATSSILSTHWKAAVADQRLSNEEMAALEAMAANFGLEVETDEMSHNLIERFRWFWLAENGTFPTVEVPINLQRNETCHFEASTRLLEMRTVTKGVAYHGPTVRIKIMKGVYYRAGAFKGQRIKEDVLQEIDRGTLYVTNKRVIFLGDRKNKTFTYRSILGFVPYSDAIEIERTSGKNPVFVLDDPEWASVLFASLLARS